MCFLGDRDRQSLTIVSAAVCKLPSILHEKEIMQLMSERDAFFGQTPLPKKIILSPPPSLLSWIV